MRPKRCLYVGLTSHTSGSPAQARPITGCLAQATRGRVFASKYSLAPKYMMPTLLLDIAIAYYSLLNPLPGALHSPVPADRIIVARRR